MGIKKKLELREIRGLTTGAQAMGNTLFPGRAGIVIDPELFIDMPEDQQEFLLAHEISHIKKNDVFSIFVGSALIGVIATVALCILFPPLAVFSPVWGSGAFYLGALISGIAMACLSIWRESCADKLAFDACSEEGKKGAIQFFEDFREGGIEYRNEEDISVISRIWRKFSITKQGNFRLDLLHPSLTSRIKYLKQRAPILPQQVMA